jgi:hypothetical protein
MKAPEKILKQAVERITSVINKEKLAPQEAVTKIAEEMNLNTHLIKRASEVINVALTYNHFKNNPDAKDADFPIVDAAKVASDLFLEDTSTKKASQHVSVDMYEDIPDFNKFSTRTNIKAAYVQLKKEAQYNLENTRSLQSRWDDFENSRIDFEQELLNAKVAQHDAQDKMYNSLMSLVGHFKKEAAYRTPFEEFESQAYALHKDRALPYLDFIHKTAGLKEKRGVHDDKYRFFDECQEVLTFNKFLKHASEWNKTNAVVLEKKAKMEEYLTGVTDLRKTIGESLDQVEPAPAEKQAEEKVVAEPKFVDPVWERAKLKIGFEAAWEKSAGILDGLVSTVQNTVTAEGAPKSMLPSASPSDNLERKLMLQELIVTDPVLSGLDPKQIVDAYQQFLRVAPELSKEKEVVRSELRARTAGQALSPFDAKQLIDTDTDFSKQKLLREGIGSPANPIK